jgi:hypothetical protein
MYDQRMRMKYKDDDGDMVSLRTEKDLSTLMRGLYYFCFTPLADANSSALKIDLQVDGKRTCKLFLAAKSEAAAKEERDSNAQARQAAFLVFDAFLDPIVVINDVGIVQHANPVRSLVSL